MYRARDNLCGRRQNNLPADTSSLCSRNGACMKGGVRVLFMDD